METTQFCQTCGKPLAPNAPKGLCPECLMKAAFPTDAPAESGAPSKTGFTPPSLEELAPHFPQLEILELIGRGGMGAVYKARQPALDRLVALKILPPEKTANNPGFAERFTREARALARLNHPNIVSVHEFGQSGPFHFFIMEFVDGPNLRQVEQAGKLAPREALEIIPQICAALQFAHDEGIVHRDIKPENVLVDKRGRVKIADFGIAKILDAAAQSEPLTGEQHVIGTPHYMAPEQIEKPTEVDHRADIYSLGVVFYEMLTGELPLGKFAAPSRKVEVDVRLDDVVLRALEKEPNLRYQQASVLKTDVETISAGPAKSETSPQAGGDPKATVPPRYGAGAPGSGAAPVAARCSRTAILGACWAALFFLSLPIVLFLANAPHNPGRYKALIFLLAPLMLAGSPAPFATTLLGWLAVSRIRRSAGRVYGLGLAVFDGLFFPLLALDVFIICFVMMACKLAFYALHPAPNFKLLVLFLLVISVIAAIVLDVWIVRRVWRVVNRPIEESPASAAPGVGKRGVFWKTAIALFCVFGILLLAIPVFYLAAPRRERPTEITEPSPNPRRTITSPFIGNFPGGTVELLALAPHPSTNGPAWHPDGTLSNESVPEVGGRNWADGKVMREIALKIRSRAGTPAPPVLRFEPEWAVAGMGSTLRWEDPGQTTLTFVQAIACTPGTVAMSVKVGVVSGDWETAITLPISNSGTMMNRETSENGGIWEAMIETSRSSQGDVAVAFHYSYSLNFETRMVYVNADGNAFPLKGDGSTQSVSGSTHSIVTLRGDDFARIKKFELQRRRYQWVEFYNVSLQPDINTSVEVMDVPTEDKPGIHTGPVTFGKVTERMVGQPGTDNLYLDLDTGRFVNTVPPGDISVAGGNQEDGRIRAGFSLATVRVDADQWSAPASKVVDAVSGKDLMPWATLGAPPGDQTYFFRTQEGAMGVLLLTTVPPEPASGASTVRVRYKLVQPADDLLENRDGADGSVTAVSNVLRNVSR